MRGWSRTIDLLALEVDAPPGIPLRNWTIRMKHTSLSVYPEEPIWETDGWTVVYASEETISTKGWVSFVFNQPFEYDGVSSLMIDFSFYNDAYDRHGVCMATKSTADVSLTRASDNEYGDPLLWSEDVPGPEKSRLFPNLRLGPPPTPVVVEVTPAAAAGFDGGVWTGRVTALDPAAGARLWTSDADHPWGGNSDWFTIVEPIPAR